MTRSIAAAQTVPVRGDIEANVAQHLRLVQAAAKEQAQILVFPELSLTGYELDLADDLAFSLTDPRVASLAEAASSHSMILIVGAPVRIGAHLYLEKDIANLRASALRHSMAVVFANYGGPSGGLASAGRSAIWSQSGELVAQLEASGSGVAVATENRDGWRGKTVTRP